MNRILALAVGFALLVLGGAAAHAATCAIGGINYTCFSNSDGNFSLAASPAQPAVTGTAWTSSTTVNSLQTVGAAIGAPAYLVNFVQTSTITGGVVTFQCDYGGGNWGSIQNSQVVIPPSGTAQGATYTFVASTNQPIVVLAGGCQGIRLNLTTVITGSGSVTPIITALNYAPLVRSVANPDQVQLVIGGAVNAVGNPIFTSPATGANFAEETGGNLAQSVTDFGAPGATACASDTASCNFNQQFQRIAQRLTTINTTLGSPIQTTGGTVGLVAGSATVGKIDILGNAGATMDVAVGGASAPTNALVFGGVFNTSLPTLSSGQAGAIQVDSNGRTLVSPTGLTVAQGSTTSGQTGSLIMGATTTSPPSETTAQSNAVSLDLNGGLRTSPVCNKVINISQTATTDVHTFTGFGYICSINLIASAAMNIGVDEGTGTTCETSGTALIGVSSTSAATPNYPVAANGGFVMTSGVPFMRMQASADHLCVLQGAGTVAGTITYADLTN